ncbi:MAG TPA: GFA family protein [Gaiellaceae bacterium]|nr:GFA family protein [Gaiellaceae bacterium]
MASDATMRGGCLCGAVRFEVTSPFLRVSQCHCTTCKAISGGVGTATGRVPTRAVRVLGGRELITTYQPDEGLAKSFCSACGSNLFGSGWPDSEFTGVRLTALDEPFDGKPEMHIWVRSVAPWETLPDDGLPRYDEGAP